MRRASFESWDRVGLGFWSSGVGSRNKIGVVLWGVVRVFSSWVQRWWRWRFSSAVRNIWRVCRARHSDTGSRGSMLGFMFMFGGIIDAGSWCPALPRWCV